MEVFVYGTLTDHATTTAILDEYTYQGSATLVGLQRVDGRYPTLVPGGTTEGRILSTPESRTLDDYEGVDRGLYFRRTLPVADGDRTVECYIGNPDALGVDADWPGTGAISTRIADYCDQHPVVVRPHRD